VYRRSSSPFGDDICCTRFLQSRARTEVESKELAKQFEWTLLLSACDGNVDDPGQQRTQHPEQNGKQQTALEHKTMLTHKDV